MKRDRLGLILEQVRPALPRDREGALEVMVDRGVVKGGVGAAALGRGAGEERAAAGAAGQLGGQHAHGARGVDEGDDPLAVPLAHQAQGAAVDAVEQDVLEVEVQGLPYPHAGLIQHGEEQAVAPARHRRQQDLGLGLAERSRRGLRQANRLQQGGGVGPHVPLAQRPSEAAGQGGATAGHGARRQRRVGIQEGPQVRRLHGSSSESRERPGKQRQVRAVAAQGGGAVGAGAGFQEGGGQLVESQGRFPPVEMDRALERSL